MMPLVERRLRPLGLTIVAVLLSIGAPLAVTGADPAHEIASPATVALPETLLVVQWPASTSTSSDSLIRRKVSVLEPASGALRPLLDGAQQPVVSADGRELYFVQYVEDGAVVHANVVVLASDSLAPVWTTSVVTMPSASAQQASLLSRAVAETPDRVYVATYREQHADAIEIVGLDRADGHEQTRWRVDLQQAIGGLSLVTAADGRSLHVLISGQGSFGPNSAPPLTLLRLGLPDGNEQARFGPLSGPDAGYFVWDGRPTPDGRALYKVTPDDGQPATRVSFLDLATGSFERINVNFKASPERDFPAQEWGASPDGQLLYVLSPVSQELATLDLATRRILHVAALATPAAPPTASLSILDAVSGALRGLLVSDVFAKVPFSERLQVSSDGRHLFAVGAQTGRNGLRADGIWVVDTSQLQVTHHWLPGAQPWSALLSADDRYLYVQDSPGPNGPMGSLVRIVDTATGSDLGANQLVGNVQLFSVANLYSERNGHAPHRPAVIESQPPQPVATMTLSLTPRAVLSGDSIAVEARFVDPGTGSALPAGQNEVQYEPPAQVFAILSQGKDLESGTRLALDPADYGVYRGTVTAPDPSPWSQGRFTAQLTAQWPDGSVRRTLVEDAVTVQPALMGSDGRRYMLRLTSEPERPVADQPATVRIAFVDAETGAPLVDTIGLAGGPTASVEIGFFQANGGFTKPPLTPIGDGVYEGQVRLFAAGAWRGLVTIGSPIESTFAIGTLEASAR